MVRIAGNEEIRCLFIAGYGIAVTSSFELAPGVVIEQNVPQFELQSAGDGSQRFEDYSAVISGRELVSFALRVECDDPGPALAAKGWNALWDFHLLSLAAQAPVCSVYSMVPGPRPTFSSANRAGIIRPFGNVVTIAPERLSWARTHKCKFDALIRVPTFSTAMRCYGNSHHLFDHDLRIMLLWSGIEGLLSVDAELSRRIALYSALIIDGNHSEKVQWFSQVKKAYGVRSKAVHGATMSPEMLQSGYSEASRILVRLLARCVEIGRVPTPAELDALAVGSTVG